VVDVCAVIDAHHVDGMATLIDAVDDPVRTATGRTVSGKFTRERFANQVWVVQQGASDELAHGGCDRKR
jgi:hypothetical protein